MSSTPGREQEDDRSSHTQSADSGQMSTQSISSKTFCRRITSWRYRVTLLLHMASVIVVALRMNISLAIVCMMRERFSNGSQVSEHMGNSSSAELTGGKLSLTAVSREFDWDSSIQGLILSSGGFINFLVPIFTDALCRHMGSKLVLTSFILLSGALTLLNPLAARTSPYFLIVLRVLVGPSVGIVLALLTDLFSWWAPDSEKVTMASLAYAGVNVGDILVGAPSGYMCSIPIDNGWPFIFYVHGAIAIVWCVVWHLCATERPEDHPFISEEEKTYIVRTRFAMEVNQEKTVPPYLSIAKSKPVWGYVLLMTAYSSNCIIFFSYLPKYISSVFQFSSEQVGLVTSASYLSRILGVVVFNFLSNSLFSRTHLAKNTIRKVVQCSGFFFYTVPLLILGFLKNIIACLILLNIIMIGQCSPIVSAYILPLDMAPRYSGFLTAVYTSLAGVIVIPGLVATGLMTPEGTLEEWRNVFIMLGASFTLGTVAFLLLGSSELQPWARPPDNTAVEEKNRPVTFNLMICSMSMGPPASPKINQTRIRFDTSVDYNFQCTSYTRDTSLWPDKTGDGRQHRTTLTNVTRITVSELEELRFDEESTTAPDQRKNVFNPVNVTRTDFRASDAKSKDWVNLGFDPGVIAAGEELAENKTKVEKMV